MQIPIFSSLTLARETKTNVSDRAFDAEKVVFSREVEWYLVQMRQDYDEKAADRIYSGKEGKNGSVWQDSVDGDVGAERATGNGGDIKMTVLLVGLEVVIRERRVGGKTRVDGYLWCGLSSAGAVATDICRANVKGGRNGFGP